MFVGEVIHFSVVGGLPNFSRHSPRNAPNRPAKIRGSNSSRFGGTAWAREFIAGLGYLQRCSGHAQRVGLHDSHSSHHNPCQSLPLQLQLQQPDLQGQGFLGVGVEPALNLLYDAQILHCRVRRDPLRHALGARQLWECQ